MRSEDRRYNVALYLDTIFSLPWNYRLGVDISWHYICTPRELESGRWEYGITLKQYVFSEIDSNTGYFYIVSIYNEAFQDTNKMRMMYDNFATRVTCITTNL